MSMMVFVSMMMLMVVLIVVVIVMMVVVMPTGLDLFLLLLLLCFLLVRYILFFWRLFCATVPPHAAAASAEYLGSHAHNAAADNPNPTGADDQPLGLVLFAPKQAAVTVSRQLEAQTGIQGRSQAHQLRGITGRLPNLCRF
jgi:hypothetical protein